ncbi:EF hand [Boseongicola aestuarii]|uniref:EF hand n=2 Tax=Boseongicola aestuarii TaxID=1470561 RepID=A0A238J1T7_9RHOB|nr:EF hand [Boseongicola aestuarii]
MHVAIELHTLETYRPILGLYWRPYMKLSQLLLTTSICAVVAMPAFAQARSFADVDTDGNGELSLEELKEAFGNAGANSILVRNDRDGDGAVTVAEIKISKDDEDDDDEDDEDDDESSDEDDDEDDDESSDEDDDSDDESSDEADD